MNLVTMEDDGPIAVHKARILQALNLNPKDPKTQALLLVCERYGLDPLLKHMLLIEGNPYITRDGLLHVAHASGHFDGLVVEEEGESSSECWARVSVYRNDMRHPFTFRGRFPKKGRKGKGHDYAPEMAVKCAEAMALRRAFDVTGIPAADEMHDSPAVWPTPDDGSTHEQRVRINELSAELSDEQRAAARAFVDEHGIQLAHMTAEEADLVIGKLLSLDDASPPDVVGEGDDDDGTPAAEASSSPPKLETVGGVKPSERQNKRLHALATETIQPPEELAASEHDQYRREALLFLAASLGYPGLTSRKQIGDVLAAQLIEALETGEMPASTT